MDPSALIPTPDAIPVAWWWFEGLNVLTFSVHILLVNVLLGGGIFALYLRSLDRMDASAQAVAGKLPIFFALAANMGVPPLLFVQVQYGQFFYTSSILSALWWLACVDLLILGYYAFYIHQHNQTAPAGHGNEALWFGVAATGFISVVFTVVLTQMLNPESWLAYFDNPHGTILTFSDPTLIPRYLHFALATLALGGLLAALLAKFGKGSARGLKIGMAWFTYASAAQMLTGVWWLYALDREMMVHYVGGNPFAALMFLVAFVLVVPTVYFGAARKPVAASVSAGLCILFMCAIRSILRQARLETFFSPSDLAVTGEYSPMVMFLVALVIGVAFIVYMLRLGFKPQEEG